MVLNGIRRGAAKDASYMSKDSTQRTGLANASVAAESGHSTIALDNGITVAYIGNSNAAS
jgi:hypothetical protein